MKQTIAPLLCSLSLVALLGSCGMTQESTAPSLDNPGYPESYDSGMDYALGGGLEGNPGYATVPGTATAWNPLDYQEDSPVASWELMKKHGEYHASSKGNVYSYGEQGMFSQKEWDNFWNEGKKSIQDAGKEIEEALDYR